MHNIYDNPPDFNFIEEHYKLLYNISGLDKIHETIKYLPEKDLEFFQVPVQKFGVSDRSSVFIKDFYNFVDKDPTFNKVYESFINSFLKKLLCTDQLVVQRTPNIRFHLPGFSNIGYIENNKNKYPDLIGIHTDSEFGHPLNEINVIIALTDMFGTNSIYYESLPDSGTDIYDYKNLELKKEQIYIGNLNKCNHYNKINSTNVSRVSLDFRVLKLSDYQNNTTAGTSVSANKKFTIGDYYTLM